MIRHTIFMWNLPRDVHVGSAGYGGAHRECRGTGRRRGEERGTEARKTPVQGRARDTSGFLRRPGNELEYSLILLKKCQTTSMAHKVHI